LQLLRRGRNFVFDRFLWRREKELDFHFSSSGDCYGGAVMALASTSAALAIATYGGVVMALNSTPAALAMTGFMAEIRQKGIHSFEGIISKHDDCKGKIPII